uniref:Uncharacterized protein n=1 Tax=Pseudoalteromonas citrea DSM 8771 TaxID=1117314 RepID=U1JA83_9GAMM
MLPLLFSHISVFIKGSEKPWTLKLVQGDERLYRGAIPRDVLNSHRSLPDVGQDPEQSPLPSLFLHISVFLKGGEKLWTLKPVQGDGVLYLEAAF